MLQNPKVAVFPEVAVRGVESQVYLDRINERVIVIHTEGPFENFIMKAQPYSQNQLQVLTTELRLD